MTSHRMRSAPSLLALLFALTHCDNADVQTWSPKDHDGEAKAGQVDGIAAPGEEDAVVVAIAWKENCSRCHGMDGAGNTPEGRMVKAANLAQTTSTDEELANTITKGRNKMPSFGKALSPNIVKGLVHKIRGFARGPKK